MITVPFWKDLDPVVNPYSIQEFDSNLAIHFVLPKRLHLRRTYLVIGRSHLRRLYISKKLIHFISQYCHQSEMSTWSYHNGFCVYQVKHLCLRGLKIPHCAGCN